MYMYVPEYTGTVSVQSPSVFFSLSCACSKHKKVGCKYKLTWITIDDYVHTFGSGLIFGDIIVVLLSINTTVSDDSVAVELMGGKYIHTYMLFSTLFI